MRCSIQDFTQEILSLKSYYKPEIPVYERVSSIPQLKSENLSSSFSQVDFISYLSQYGSYFLKDNSTIIVQKGTNFAQEAVFSSQIQLDNFSSIFHFQKQIFVSGGKNSEDIQRNFQKINQSNLQVEFTYQMLFPRNSHGMALDQQKQALYLISGNIDENQDQQSCEYFDFGTKSFEQIEDIPQPVKNFGCFIKDGKVYVLGGVQQNCIAVPFIQVFNQTLQAWMFFQNTLPNGSPVNIIEFNNKIYFFGPFLDRTYLFSNESENQPFTEVGEKYFGEPSNQNSPIYEYLTQQKIQYFLLYDGQKVYSFNTALGSWKEEDFINAN